MNCWWRRRRKAKISCSELRRILECDTPPDAINDYLAKVKKNINESDWAENFIVHENYEKSAGGLDGIWGSVIECKSCHIHLAGDARHCRFGNPSIPDFVGFVFTDTKFSANLLPKEDRKILFPLCTTLLYV